MFFGLRGRVHDSQNQYYLSLETSIYFKKSQNAEPVLENITLGSLEIWQNEGFGKVGADGRRTNLKIRHTISRTSRISVQYLPENMSLHFGNMGSLSSKKH